MNWRDQDRKQPRPSITPSAVKRVEIPADVYGESLAQYAPEVRRCFSCGKLCCATPEGLVLWHQQVHPMDGTIHECPGVSFIGQPVKPKERHLEYVG